ncbi:hypothetical protein DMENIID0001_036480 [Sergentomyia squamirostris]
MVLHTTSSEALIVEISHITCLKFLKKIQMAWECSLEQVEFLHRHISYLEVSGRANEIDWEQITSMLNEMGPSTYSLRDWKKCWMSNKYRVQKTYIRDYIKTNPLHPAKKLKTDIEYVAYEESQEKESSPTKESVKKKPAEKESPKKSQKKQADKDKEDFQKKFDKIAYSCRICLTTEMGLTPIDEKLKFMFEKLTGRILESHDISVMKICSGCKGELARSYKFRLLCLKTEREILALKNLKEKEKEAKKIPGDKKKKRKETIKDDKMNEIIDDPEEPMEAIDYGNENLNEDIQSDQYQLDKERSYRRTTTSPITTKTLLETCNVCGKELKAINMTSHMKIHENSGQSQMCSICGHTFSTSDHLRTHYTLKHNQRNYSCSFCQKKYHTRYHARLHEDKCPERTAKTADEFTCPYCFISFYVQGKLDDHIRVKHTQERPFQCDQCGSYLATKNSLKSHMYNHRRRALEEPKKRKPRAPNPALFVPCTICGQMCSSEYQLVSHIADEHSAGQEPTPRSLECHICKKIFLDESVLTIHIEKMHYQTYEMADEDDIIEQLIEVDEDME